MVCGIEIVELYVKSQITSTITNKFKNQSAKIKITNQNAKFKNKLFYDEFNILNFNIVILIFDF